MSYLKLSKQWRLDQRGKELYVFGGQDAIFTVDLQENESSFFAKLKYSQKFSASGLQLKDRIVLEQLLSANVIIPSLDISKKQLPRIKIVGDKAIAYRLTMDNKIFQTTNSNQYDLLILVRTNETFSSFLKKQDYLKLTRPHLFIDMAYNHTVSLGPLVFPGATSCVACLEGRISTRWGDDKPPAKPQSLDELLGLGKEWLMVELKKIFVDEDYSLVNKTVVLDAQKRIITSNKLLTVPLCPYCKKGKMLSTGKLEYTFSRV